MYSLPEVTAQDVKRKTRTDLTEVRVTYNNKSQFKEIAKVLGIMDDFRVSRKETISLEFFSEISIHLL